MKSSGRVSLSKWCHALRRDGVTALFHSINLGVVYLSDEAAEHVLRETRSRAAGRSTLERLVGSDTVNALLDEGLVVSKREDDDETLVQTRDRLKSDITLELLYLLVTDNCNLRCRYCFEETPAGCGTDFRPVTMSRETAKLALEAFGRLTTRYGNPEKTKVIHLYGGEPLMNPDVVKYAVEYANELKAASRMPNNTVTAIVTNGTLLTAELAEFLTANRVTVGLSLDGPKAVNNLYRIGKKRGLDVYDTVIAAYDLLKSRGVSVGISVTLTPESVDRFDEVLRLFTTRLADADGFSLNIMHFNHGVTPPSDYYKKAVQCQLAAFEVFRTKGVFEERVMRKARAFVDRRTMYADCGVVGNQLVVAPDGKVGVCQDFVKPRTYFDGNVRDPDFDPIKSGLFSDWIDRSPLNMPGCQSCSALGMCGGGCPASAELKHGSRWRIDERICLHSTKVLEWLVWDTYAKLVAESPQ